jgi:hypothetical protein
MEDMRRFEYPYVVKIFLYKFYKGTSMLVVFVSPEIDLPVKYM